MKARPGKVYLVGAGPGDPGLLTRRGAEVLGRSEVVIYDFLASPQLLALAPEGAELIYVGKKGGDHTLSQEKINELIKAQASAGRMVVRLKGGDPFIFGRGGEEAEVLAQAGIPFEVVPGVSSALAVPAYAGIPLTHRAHASTVTLATGHEDPTKPASRLEWSALARTGGTLVFLMGVKRLAENAASLVEAGLPASTPAALIEWGATSSQRCLAGDLGSIAAEAQAQGFGPPAVFVVGQVVGLRQKLAWLEKRPLWGLRALVTRTQEGASRMAALLEEQGAEAIIFPTIAVIETKDPGPMDEAIGRLEVYDWVVFTSANGVDFFFRRLQGAGLDSRAFGGIKICAIGPATAAALAAHGLKADAIPAEYRAEAMADELADEAGKGARFLLARAAEAREVLPQKLIHLGGRVEVVPAYQTVLPAEADTAGLKERFGAGKVDLVVFTASSTVKNLARLYPETLLADLLAKTTVATIGPITAATAEELGLKVAIQAREYTLEGLIAAIIDWRLGQT